MSLASLLTNAAVAAKRPDVMLEVFG